MKLSLVSLLFILFLKALFVLYVILYAGIGLGPDEAQYWTWSQKLAFGYYSKPPAIAWQIWLGTKLFGNTELGVRFGSLVLGTLMPLAVYALSRQANLSTRAAFWAGVTLALTPLGFLSTFFAITDVGVVLFWTLALIPIARAIENDASPSYFLIGVLIACGALFKWQIYWLWAIIFILLYFFPHFRRRELLWGVLISLVGLLPSVVWNVSHEFATFRHVFSTFKGAEEHAGKANFFDFLGAQIALLSPIVFFLLIYTFFQLPKSRSSALRFLGYSCLIIVLVHLFYACFKKVQGNWCDYAYPAGFVWLAVFTERRWFRHWLMAGLLLSLLLVAFLFALPTMQKRSKGAHLSYSVNPFRHNLGWGELESLIARLGFDSHKQFLFSDSYQMTSILSFYNAEQTRAYFFNLHGIRKNQFSYWPQMSEDKLHKDGFYIVAENGSEAFDKLNKAEAQNIHLLSPYFEQVESLGIHPLFSNFGKPVKAALILRCTNYNGKNPQEVNRF